MISIRQSTTRDLTYIAQNLNPQDRAEISAQVGDNLVEAITAHLSPLTYVAWWRGKPVAAFGASPFWAGTWLVYMFGTKDSWRAVPAISKFSPTVEKEMIDRGAHRAEARSIEGHKRAHGWMTRAMGMARTADLKGHGLNGETFILFAKEYC